MTPADLDPNPHRLCRRIDHLLSAYGTATTLLREWLACHATGQPPHASFGIEPPQGACDRGSGIGTMSPAGWVAERAGKPITTNLVERTRAFVRGTETGENIHESV